MRLFAAVYVALSPAAAGLHHDSSDPVPWLLVCVAGALLGVAQALRRPALLLCAAHAGLTATWAGTVAAKHALGLHFALLMLLCTGMAAFVVSGLKSGRRAAVQTSPPR